MEQTKTLVIAECGSCHDGDFKKALRLVEAARAVGASVAKFQFWSDANRLADRRKVPESYRAIYRRYQMISPWLPALAEACAARSDDTRGKRPIEFMCSTYLPEDVATVAPYVKRFKIASFEAGDEELAIAHAPFLQSRSLIVSLGMNGNHRRWELAPNVQVLHCVSAYPAPPEAMNLGVLGGDWGEPYDPSPSPFVGLSDHSRHPWMGALAVAAGAEIIEAHLRLNDTDPENPDFATAFTPTEFGEYVKNIRFAEQVMGDGEKKLQACEEPMAQYRVTS
jgi:N,N'-diacetyllegionaminate synthase